VAPTWAMLWLPLYLLGTIVCAAGAGILFAALIVTYRDVRYVMTFVMQLWLFGTPVLYTLDIIPIEFINQPKYVSCNTNPNNFPTGFCEVIREHVYGGGINPLGLKLNFRRKRRLQIIGASTAGFIASQRPVPVDIPGGTQFNFTFDFQAGFQFYNSSRSRAWILGYRYQHVSNGYRRSFNPGLDVNMIFLGYSFFK